MADDPFAAHRIRAAYDTVAEDYEAAFADDLASLPLDREVLASAVDRFPAGGPVVDLGCGPGQVGACLADRGVPIVAVDIAPRMLAVARRGHPTIPYAAGDMRSLPFARRSCAGIVAYYSVQHVARREVPAVLEELRRVLVDGGVLVLAMHLGEGEHIADEFLGHRIETAGGTFYSRTELEELLTATGFDIETVRERGPLAHEHQSQRIYVTSRLGRRPAPG